MMMVRPLYVVRDGGMVVILVVSPGCVECCIVVRIFVHVSDVNMKIICYDIGTAGVTL